VAKRAGNAHGLAGGLLLIGAAAIFVTGAAIGFLAPSLSDAPPFVTDDVERVAAAMLTALGLVPLSLRFEGRSRPWAVVALVAFAFAAMFAAIDRIISMQVTTWAAQRYPDATASALESLSTSSRSSPSACTESLCYRSLAPKGSDGSS